MRIVENSEQHNQSINPQAGNVLALHGKADWEDVPAGGADSIKVGIFERENIALEGIKAILSRAPDIEKIESCCSDECIQAYLQRARLNVLLVSQDESFSVLSIKEICRLHPGVRILLFLSPRLSFDIAAILRAGVNGIVSKCASADDLINAIRHAARGESFLSQEFSRDLVNHMKNVSLTPREMDVLEQIAIGLSTKRIARILAISESTIKSHLKNIFEKLGAVSRSEATFIAAQRGILTFMNTQKTTRAPATNVMPAKSHYGNG